MSLESHRYDITEKIMDNKNAALRKMYIYIDTRSKDVPCQSSIFLAI